MGNAEREQVSSSRNADTLKSSFIYCGVCYGGPGYAGVLSLATSDSLNELPTPSTTQRSQSVPYSLSSVPAFPETARNSAMIASITGPALPLIIMSMN
jgi:hypothetical protein